ncbi:MAG: YHS domain-containing protein [Candidatus Micrarchaeia archaeon]
MKDLVCQMEVDKNSKFKSNYKGKTFYFCSASCKQKFDKEPETYIG